MNIQELIGKTDTIQASLINTTGFILFMLALSLCLSFMLFAFADFMIDLFVKRRRK